jgi:hypothetical protein
MAAIAIGDASRPHSAETSFSLPEPGDLAVPLLVALACLVGLVAGSIRLPMWTTGPSREGTRRSRRASVIVTLAALVLLMVVVYLATWAIHRGGSQNPQGGVPTFAPIPSETGPTSAGDPALVLALIAIATVSAVIVNLAIMTRRPALTAAPARPESVVAILDEGLDALLAERDPRRAVIAAYVAMERALARRGCARRPHEAPTEYLARVLGVAPDRAGDLQQLVNLYQIARFSEHTVTKAMRDVAVDSVRRLRADLQAAA